MVVTGSAPSSWRFFERMKDLLGHRPIANEVNTELADIDALGKI